MTNRTILLFIGTSLSLTLGLLPSTLQAQQRKPPLTPAQQKQIDEAVRALNPPKPQFDPTKYPPSPTMPPKYTDRPPAWREFLQNNQFLHAPIFAAVVTLAFAIFIWAPIVLCRTVVRAFRPCHSHQSEEGPQAPPSGDGGMSMGQKRLGGGWVLVQDGDRLIVRASWAEHIAGIALLLVLGSALVVGACAGLWRFPARENGILLAMGLLGVFFVVAGEKLFVQGEMPCILDRQAGTMQGIGSKVVCRLDEVTSNVEQYEWRTVFTAGPAYRVRLHPQVAVGGFSTPEAAEALASAVREWLRKGREDRKP
jgi:hypothetical protein